MMPRWTGWLVVASAALPLLAAGAPPAPVARPAAVARGVECHSAGKGAGWGVYTNLYGVAGAKAGARPGYDYSPALKASGVVWTKATIAAFIANPQAVAKGTQMPNPGISNPADREAIAAWLVTLR